MCIALLYNKTFLFSIFADVSSNGFGFADAYKVTKEMNAEDFIINGRLTFDPRFEMTVEKVSARLLETETSLDKLQRIMDKISKKKDDSIMNWMGWMQIESDSYEEQVARAVNSFMDPGTGEIIAVSYIFVGNTGDIDGLVLGDFKGLPIYVLIEFKHNMDGNRKTAIRQLKNSTDYLLELLANTNDEEVGSVERVLCQSDKEALQIERLRDRTCYWGFGGVQFNAPEKLPMKGKNCFTIRPNHDNKFEVKTV